jgi:hypothetical protein
MAWTIPWQIMGLQVAGDFGDVSIYTSMKGQKVVYPFSPPKEPKTAKQLGQRSRFKAACINWQTLSQTEKDDFERVSLALSLPLTGFNLWVSASLRADRDLTALERQSGITLTHPPYIP